MSGKTMNQFPKKGVRANLNNMLDFGPEKPQLESQSSAERIKQIVKKLEELNRRIDALSQRF